MKSLVVIGQKLAAWSGFPLLLLLIMLGIYLPTLNGNLAADDLAMVHLVQQSDASFSDKINNMYNFTADKTVWMEYGNLPWWSDDQLKINFWRPLSAATLWVDYTFWPNQPVLTHIHSTLWFLLMLLAGWMLYKELLPRKLAALALILLALDVSLRIPVSWIANRNALISAAFGLFAVYSHIQWRRKQGNRWLIGSLILLTLSLLGGESGITVWIYLFAYALSLDPQYRRLRAFAALIPATAIIIGWRLLYTQLGYGVAETPLYTDPGADLIAFVWLLVERAPYLLFGQLTGIDPLYYKLLSPEWKQLGSIILLVPLVGLLLLAFRLFKHSPKAQFFLLATMGATVPVTANGLVSGRLLAFVTPAAMGLLALFLHWALTEKGWGKKLVAWPLLICNLPMALATLILLNFYVTVNVEHQVKLVRQLASQAAGPSESQSEPQLGSEVGNQLKNNQRVILLNPSSPYQFLFVPLHSEYFKSYAPLSLRSLLPGHQNLKLQRKAENQLTITGDNQPLVMYHGDKLPTNSNLHPLHGKKMFTDTFRDSPIPDGFTRELSDLKITYQKALSSGLNGQQLDGIEVKLLRDQSEFSWVYWDWQSKKYLTLKLPEIGQTLLINGPFSSKTKVESPVKPPTKPGAADAANTIEEGV
ncbi:hypothetical protein [Pelagibaculum spongiae]|uniref:Glycosyltransferase RgtA/B/C/D-like domain-containing protein n=1 Tax=Pelagibaculum spongiae TaxID=2080658 RepID=A0A2V1GTH7_9GAMM|nr:hypothetical protein [Pelagibaculum spongiae]PVZ68908.1 hypothetical protein DC094_11690 [Pelagibaculum spongiae]